MRKALSILIILCFFISSLGPLPKAHADEPLSLPPVGTMVNLSPVFEPALIKGVTIDRDNPFKFNFIMDAGKSGLSGDALKTEGDRLVKYFFACLTIPEKDLWVNLSPYEKDRIIPDALGETHLGRDLLEQDYILKQLTASLIYPEKDLGKEFWNRVYTKAREMYGTSQIPVNTFNKVWIVADKATVYEHNQTAFVLDGHLKVMLEEDYLALSKHRGQPVSQSQSPHALASNIVRSIILPEIEKEVNQGRNFAPLRQIFNSLILASWFKKNLKEALLNQVYADKNTVKGVNLNDTSIKEKIYRQYLQAYKKGVFNFIKEETDPNSNRALPRKYFSGGFNVSPAMLTVVRGDNPVIRSKIEGETGVDKELSNLAVELFLNKKPSVLGLASSSNAAMTATSTGESPELGITLDQLVSEIEKEIQNHGTGNIPLIDTISDQHGTIDKFDRLIVDALRSAPAGKDISSDFILDPNKTLLEQGIDLRLFKGQILIHNLGDFMDRGPNGEKVYRRSKELIEGGISDFVIGNHDLWMFMNLMGFHLPWYDGFELYGYDDSAISKKWGGLVRLLLEQKHKENPQTREKGWWAEKLYEFRSFQEEEQRKTWEVDNKLVNGPEGLFAQIVKGMSEDEKLEWYNTESGKVWNKLRGFDPNVGEVATGVRAVGLVSIKWWRKLLADFEQVYEHLSILHKIQKNDEHQQAWLSAISLMKGQIIPQLVTNLEDKVNPRDGSEPQWWWRVFEAIDNQNYTSPEWWAMDWGYHNGWGPTVFKEINNTYHDGAKVVTVSNYLDDDSPLKGVAVLNEIAMFFRANFNLHIRDIFQMDYMHAFLPIDPETGEFYFNYKGRQYRGKGGTGYLPYWVGLKVISDDVKNARNDSEVIKIMYEAMTVVNAWYADNTTEAKVSHVADAINKVGLKKFLRANGIDWLSTGHLPMHDFLKLMEDRRRGISHLNTTEDEMMGVAFSDGGMGERFGGGGKYLSAGPHGFMLRGFPGKYSEQIVDNPPTIIYKKDNSSGNEKERVVFRNDNPVGSDIFLEGVLDRIRRNKQEQDSGVNKAMTSTSLATRYSNGKDVRLIVSDLTGTLVLVKFNSATGRNEQVSSKEQDELNAELTRRLRKDGLLVIETGDRLYDAQHWLLNQLPEDVLKNIIVLSQTGMVGSRYDPIKKEFVQFLDASKENLTSGQQANWDKYKEVITNLALGVSDIFLGSRLETTIDDDGITRINKYEQGSLTVRTHQLAFTAQEDQQFIKEDEIADINAKIAALNLGAQAFKVKNGDDRREKMYQLLDLLKNQDQQIQAVRALSFSHISTMRAGKTYIDMPFIPDFDKFQGLQVLAQNEWFKSLIEEKGITWADAMFTGDSIKGNDGPAARYIHEQGGVGISVGEADHNHADGLPDYIKYEVDQIGPKGTLRALTPASNPAMVGEPNVKGGIDLNSSDMSTTIHKEGNGVEIRLDPALLARIRKEGIQSLTPFIYKITPINNIWSLLGMQKPMPEAQLVAV